MTDEHESVQAAATPRTRSRWRALGWSAAFMLLFALPALLVGGVAWLALTPAGTAWLVTQLPGLTVTAPQGSLLGDFAAERVLIALPAGEDRIVIDDLRWQGMTLARAEAAHVWLRVQARSVQAGRVELRLTPGPPKGAPQQLRLPVELVLEAIRIGELHAPSVLGEQPVKALEASLHLGADGGSVHRIDDLRLTWDRLAAQGSGRIEADAPLAVQARVEVVAREATPSGAPALAATLGASGPLARLALQGTLRGTTATAPAGRRPAAAPPSLDVQATLTPFAAWPLAMLELRTQSLDLAALHSAAPTTALEGTAAVQTSASDTPASIAVALVNARAGRFDEGRLPLRSLHADLRARPDDPARGEIQSLDLVLGTAREAGGRVQGRGSWAPGEANVVGRLTDLAPRVLDARAAALRVSGQATLDYRSGADAAASPTFALRGQFNGSVPIAARSQPLTLELDTVAGAQRIEVRRARLQAGATRASLEGRAIRLRPDGADWRIDAKAELDDVDPSQWWAGPEGSAWRKGPHRIDATLMVDGLLPRGSGAALLQQLAQVQGRAEVRLGDGSMLGGQPLAGGLALRGGTGTQGAEVEGSLAVSGSTLTLRGRIAADAADHWEIGARGADIAPWSALIGLASAKARPAQPVAGKLDADLAFDGRWPRIASRGSISLADARLGPAMRLARGSARWAASILTPQAPLDVQAEVEQFDLGGQKFDSLRLRVEGTAAAHRVAVDGATPARPPKWMDLLHGADSAPGTGTLAELVARGGLQVDPAWLQPLRWQGRLEKLQLMRAAPAAQRRAWLAVAETSVDLQYDPLTRAPAIAIGPGRAALPNLALRWDGLRWKGVPGAPQFELQAEIEPYLLAPLLARVQPEFGWGGDLVVAGRVNIRSAPTFVAEVEIGRQQGDLSVTDERGPQALELTDLRLGVDARDGTWHFTQALAGRSLGALGAAVSVRTDPKALWPASDAPLQGVMELQVANLAAWGAWAPPGWRLKGQVHASAAFGGTFGAPEYSGEVDGSGLGLRNLVEGVDLRDGVLDIALKGDRAHIRKLQASAGEGSVKVEGEALFGATPELQLRLVAERMRLLGRVDRRIVLSGDAALALKAETAKLDGRFSIDEGLIDISRGTAPTLGDDVRVVRGPPPDEPAAVALPPGRRMVRSVDMNVRVDLGRALRLRGRGLDTRLEGDLLFSTPDGRLALTGTINAAQGTYSAYNQKLRIERGTLVFTGPLDNPRLDILAVRPNLDVRVGVRITGSTHQPRVALYSDPDMSDNAKISWLVLGRPPEETSGADTALLQAAAMAILSGEGDTAAAQLARLNPLDTFSVRQTDGAVRDTVLTVGKQLSQRWYIGYERTLSQTAGNWQLIYRLAQRITVRLQAGVDNSIDVIWSWRWD